MGLYVLLVLLIILAIVGVSEICRHIICCITQEKGGEFVTVVPIKGHCEQAEQLLRGAAAKLKWLANGKQQQIICLDCGMDKETRDICELVCRDYGFIKIKTKEELAQMID